MKKTLYLIITLLLMCSCTRKEKTFNKEELFTGARFVKAVEAHRTNLERILNYSGSVKFDDAIEIIPPIAGKIEKIHVYEGQRVSKNQLIVEIDKKSLEQFSVNFTLAEKNYQRAQNLLNENAIDLKSFDDIENIYLNARTVYETALENLNVLAPFDGTISTIYYKENETYNPMLGKGVARLISNQNIYIEVFVSETDVTILKTGQKVRIKLNTLEQNNSVINDSNIKNIASEKINNSYLDGELIWISPEHDTITGMIKVKISLRDKTNLRYNQFVSVEFIPEYRENVVVIPREAILSGNKVIVNNNGYAQHRQVYIGLETRNFVEIINGIIEGELVIIEGNTGLEDGYPLTMERN